MSLQHGGAVCVRSVEESIVKTKQNKGKTLKMELKIKPMQLAEKFQSIQLARKLRYSEGLSFKEKSVTLVVSRFSCFCS